MFDYDPPADSESLPVSARATVSRRVFVTGGATLLAGVALAARPRPAYAAPATAEGSLPQAKVSNRRPVGTRPDIAEYRPVTASSTAYAATPPEFAVDGLAVVGVRGSGWRAADTDPQWIAVDLQASCRIDTIVLTFEATAADPAFTATSRSGTTGAEILSSCATSFVIETSVDGATWTRAYQTDRGDGGLVAITFSSPLIARWIRLTAAVQATTNPLGLNGLQVYGKCNHPRPAAEGWTSRVTDHSRPPALTVAADGTVPLDSGWRVTLDDWVADRDGATLSRVGVDTTTWLPATVPGTVFSTLVDQGKLPDPVGGFNNLRAPEALSRHSWWYQRSFTLPARLATGHGRRVWLELDGINHKADIWLNGRHLGTQLYPFARGAYDTTAALNRRGTQSLAIEVSPLPHPGSPGDKGDGISWVNSFELDLDDPTYACASGWDWMPAVRDRGTGIWNHVRLRSTGDVILGDPRVDTALPALPKLDTAELTITVPVRNVGPAAHRVTVTAKFDRVRVSRSIQLAAGADTEIVFSPTDYTQLRLRNPQLWWPNGYGDPILHQLTLTTTASGQSSDSRTSSFGIRQVDYDYYRGFDINAPQQLTFPAVQARYVRMLGKTRATQFGFSLYTMSVFADVAPNTDLALHKTATASSTDDPSRPASSAVDGDDTTRWSSAAADDQWLQVDLAQTYSITGVTLLWETAFAATASIQTSLDGTIWTDTLDVTNPRSRQLQISVNGVRVMCRGGNWGYDELLRRVLDGRLETAIRMHADQNFTMIRNWLGTSNREEFYDLCDQYGILVWNDFWSGHPVTDVPGYLDVVRDTIVRYRSHPCLVVWCGSNEHYPDADVNGPTQQAVADLDPTRLYQGNSAADIVGGHGPYSWVDPNSYVNDAAGFHTEIGFPTVSTAETMQQLAGAEDAWPISQVWDYHDWAAQGGQAVLGYQQAIEDRLGTATDLADFCAKAQFVNFESMRAIFEAWNHKLWNDASGVLLWMSHPAWYSTVWQTYDYAFDVNGSYYGARKGCEPLHVQAAPGSWQIEAVNHTSTALNDATVTAQILTPDGIAVGQPQTTQVSVQASSMKPAFAAAWPWNTVTFPATTARYVRMHGLTRATQYGFSLFTMSVFGPHKPDTDLALNTTATASSQDEADHGPQNAVDGDPTTRWSSAHADDQWLQVDFGQAVAVNRVQLVWETAIAATFAIETSTDGQTWQTAQSVTVGGLHLLKLQLHDSHGTLQSDNLYWHYSDPKDMQVLNASAAASLAARVTSRRTVGKDTVITVRVTNTAHVIAPMVVLSLRGRGNERILPTYYSDNYVWLLAGEEREFTLTCATAALGGWRPAVQVSAYRVPAQVVS